jgi:hypothetical protein
MVRALEIAETGLLRAELEARTETDHDGGGIGVSIGEYAGGRFRVAVERDALDPAVYTFVATGEHGPAVRRIERSVRIYPLNSFPAGLFSRDSMLIEGNVATDAYRSADGNYASQRHSSDADGPYALAQGHLGSNGSFELSGSSAVVRGDARPGPGHTLVTVGHPTISGTTAPLPAPVLVPDPPREQFEAAYLDNDNAELIGTGGYDPATFSLRLTSRDTATLTGGTYFFSDVVLEDQSELRITGPSVLYVTGAFHIGNGGLWNGSSEPPDALVFVHPYPIPAGYLWEPPIRPSRRQPGEQVVLSGGAKSALAVYAPGADIAVLTNADLWGAFVGRSVRVEGNPSVHYDLTLRDFRTPMAGRAVRIHWRELGTLTR